MPLRSPGGIEPIIRQPYHALNKPLFTTELQQFSRDVTISRFFATPSLDMASLTSVGGSRWRRGCNTWDGTFRLSAMDKARRKRGRGSGRDWGSWTQICKRI